MDKTRKTVIALCIGAGLFLGYYTTIAIVTMAKGPKRANALLLDKHAVLEVSDFPEDWLKFLLRIEDPGFPGHNGIDMWTNGAGQTTITEEVAKILFDPQMSTGRLMVSAYFLNRKIPKKDQLKIFINYVSFGMWEGKKVEGFAQASKTLYGKFFKTISLAEFLALAAMIKDPEQFHVLRHTDANQERVDRIARLLQGECGPYNYRDDTLDDCVAPK